MRNKLWLLKLDKFELIDLVAEYDAYVIEVCGEDNSEGNTPVCVSEFYDNEFMDDEISYSKSIGKKERVLMDSVYDIVDRSTTDLNKLAESFKYDVDGDAYKYKMNMSDIIYKASKNVSSSICDYIESEPEKFHIKFK